MADKNPTGRGCLASDCVPRDEDAKAERIVLTFLLEEHPDHLTIPELSRTLNSRPGRFEERDAVERAVRELVGAGLLHCRDGLVLPTRAALYFARLGLD